MSSEVEDSSFLLSVWIAGKVRLGFYCPPFRMHLLAFSCHRRITKCLLFYVQGDPKNLPFYIVGLQSTETYDKWIELALGLLFTKVLRDRNISRFTWLLNCWNFAELSTKHNSKEFSESHKFFWTVLWCTIQLSFQANQVSLLIFLSLKTCLIEIVCRQFTL